MKKFQRFLASLLAFVFSITLASGWSGTADAEENFSLANRYNVMLVVDKSGSLRDIDGVGTDPDGLRFDALRLFLGLLTEKGNNVGLIAFAISGAVVAARKDMDIFGINLVSSKMKVGNV